MNITGCLHTAILVSDLEAAEFFYGTVLGLPKVDRPLKFPGAWYEVGDFQLHLMATPNFSVEVQSDRWGRNPHLAFAVADLEAAKAELLRQGYPIQSSASGRSALFTRDPDGNVVELSAA